MTTTQAQTTAKTRWPQPEILLETPPRPPVRSPRYQTVRTFMIQRFAVGLVGLAMPTALIGADLFFFNDIGVRGSLSAYYHSGMRDYFVASLVLIAGFLASYKVSQWNSDNLLSLVAAAGALVTAFVPTGIPASLEEAGWAPTPLQDHLGLDVTDRIHFWGAVFYIIPLGMLSFVFAKREAGRPPQEKAGGATSLPPSVRAAVHTICGAGLLLSLVFIALTKVLGEFDTHSVLIGETVATAAFAVSWFLKGFEPDILLGRSPRSAATTS